MKRVIFSRVYLLVMSVIWVAEATWAQSPSHPARSGHPEAQGDSSNMYVSSTLPTTGHPTHFKKYPNTAPTAATPQRNRPSVSPYLNLARSGNPALNYFLGTQPEKQLYDTGTRVQQLNTQVGGIQQDLQRPSRLMPSSRDFGEENLSPLKRRTLEQRGELPDEGALVDSLRKLKTSQNESSQQEQTALKAILEELKGIRQNLAPKKETTEPEKTKDGAESK